MTTNLVKYETGHGPTELSTDIIKKYLCPKATDAEAYMFLKLCAAQGLNPFLREAYLIKYGDAPATMVVGKDTFTQRAESHPQFDGCRAGLVVLRLDGNGELLETEGSLKRPDDALFGGWAEVYRKDRKVPTKAVVSLDEYSSNQSSWKKMPATMIRKVALVQALREAFPFAFVGLYDSTEMNVDLPEQPVEAPPPTKKANAEPTVHAQPRKGPAPSLRPPTAKNAPENALYCQMHAVYFTARTKKGNWVHPEKEGQTCVMEKGVVDSQTGDIIEPWNVQPSIAALQGAVKKAGWTWDVWLNDVLHSSLDDYIKDGGTLEKAMEMIQSRENFDKFILQGPVS